ncbi:MAG: FtsX-like permease family protein [Vicinamibacterales bacterium]
MTALRIALRACRLQPVLNLAIAGTLALTLSSAGLTWGAFECLVVHAVPGPEPDRVLSIGITRPGTKIRSDLALSAVAVLQQHTGRLAAVGAYQRNVSPVSVGTPAVEAHLVRTTTGFFESFGTTPVAGRWFGENERDQCSVVLSDSLWRVVFGRDGRAIGRFVDVAGESCVVVGVAPQGFDVPDYSNQIWRYQPPTAAAPNGGRDGVVVGRALAGTSPLDAAHELDAILRSGRIEAGSDATFSVVPLRDLVVGDLDRTLFLMASAVVVLLIAACTNIVSLLLARDWSRDRDVAIRKALGARRGDFLQDTLLHAALVASVGVIAGLGLAWLEIALARALRPASVPRLEHIEMSSGVVAVVCATAAGVVLLIAGLQARRAWRLPKPSVVREAATAASVQRHGGSGVVIASQVGLSVVLAVGAGLFAHSLIGVLRTDTGFEPTGLEYYHFSRDRTGSLGNEAASLKQLVAAANALSGVQGAALTAWPPFIGITEGTRLEIETREGWQEIHVAIQNVSADYFRVMGVPVVRGRDFRADLRTTDPCEVVVSDTMARTFWPDDSAIGRRLDLYMRQGTAIATVTADKRFCTVIGVVGDVRERVLTEPPAPRLYFSAYQRAAGSGALVVRSTSDPRQRRQEIVALIQQYVPRTTEASIRIGLVVDRMRGSVDLPEAQAWLFGLFAVMSMVVLAVGVFGLSWFTVVQRTHEVGIRLALGARPRQVSSLFLWQGARPVLVGILVGIIAAAYMTRYLGSLLPGIAPLDPLVFVVVPVIIASVAIFAVGWPVFRARRVDPRLLLRSA